MASPIPYAAIKKVTVAEHKPFQPTACMPPFLLQWTRDLHTGTTARVRINNGLSAPFTTSSECREGCNLAPALFFCTIDWLMRQYAGKLGVDIGHGTFRGLDYMAMMEHGLELILTTGMKCSRSRKQQPTRWACIQTGRKRRFKIYALDLPR